MDRTAHLRERLNDVAETSSLRERCALGADDDDVEAVEIAFRLHGDAGAGAASGGLDDVARTESAVRGGGEGRPRKGHPALNSSGGGHFTRRCARQGSRCRFGGSPTTFVRSRVREYGSMGSPEFRVFRKVKLFS